ncbi:MAG: 50S ribosomal protein L3 N(5)-glutamine methyltransferase, partial [Steroidobacteraceae bacterium]
VGRRRVMALVQRPIRERVPSAYLTGRTWFAGLVFEVTPAVLIPRSPIAELIEEGFEPWRGGLPVESVLEIGTGSGCIAVACAAWLPGARVDAVDLSHAALEVAARNVRRHGLQGRVRLVQSDVYGGVAGKRYDIVVSNPPYVPSAEMVGLPPEYAGEPVLALEAGPTGLDVVERIMLGASRHLRPGGLLVVEVGGLREEVERRWPRLPLTWLQFERGGGDVMLVRAEDCANVG